MLPALPVSTDGNRQLTDLQARFVDEYVSNGGNKEQAAIDAGYSPETARVQAYEILRKPHVLAAILERTAQELVCDAPKARKRLSELMNARSEYVALQASQDVLARVGLEASKKHDHRIAGDITVNIDLG